MISPATLEKLVGLAKAATPRPWMAEKAVSDPENPASFALFTPTDQATGLCVHLGDFWANDEAHNGDFIALAANLAVSLATELMEARERVAKLEAALLEFTVSGIEHTVAGKYHVMQVPIEALEEARTLLGDRT